MRLGIFLMGRIKCWPPYRSIMFVCIITCHTLGFPDMVLLLCVVLIYRFWLHPFNPSNTEATVVQRTQRFLKIIWTLPCWYSLDSSRWVLSDEYPCVRVSVILQYFFASFCIGQISHQQHKDWRHTHLVMLTSLGWSDKNGNIFQINKTFPKSQISLLFKNQWNSFFF